MEPRSTPSSGLVISSLDGPPGERDLRSLNALLAVAFDDVDADGAHCGPTPVAARWVARDAAGSIVGQQAVRSIPTTRSGLSVAPCLALGDLVVLPEYRGAGLGRRLVEVAVADLSGDDGGPLITRTEIVAPVFRDLGFRRTGPSLTTGDGRPFDDGWIRIPADSAAAPYVVATPFF